MLLVTLSLSLSLSHTHIHTHTHTLQHFLHAMDERFKGHAHYSSRQVDHQSKELERDRDFIIRHYAGDVV